MPLPGWMLSSSEGHWKGKLDQSVSRTLDLARALIQVSDLETARESLLAHLFAIAALTGDPPNVVLERLLNHLSDSHEWYSQYLPVIMGEADDIAE